MIKKERLYYPKDKSIIEAMLNKRRGEFFSLTEKMKKVIEEVRHRGDTAIREYTYLWNKVELNSIKLTEEEKEQRIDREEELEAALDFAFSRISSFFQLQKQQLSDIIYSQDNEVSLKLRFFPLERIGIYVPGGEAPLFSSLYMAALPAKIAGVKNIALATPPNKEGKINPYIIFCAKKLHIDEIYKLGGALAVAAFTYGTESVLPVDKIVGPGGAYFNAAKKAVWGEVGVDFIAADTELLLLADDSVDQRLVIGELKAQREHSPNAQAVLITNSPKLEGLELTIQVEDLNSGIELINLYAPEHLVLYIKQPEIYIDKIKNVGCISIGETSSCCLVDYVAGVNHILPTTGGSKFFSPLSIYDFIKFSYIVEYKESNTLDKAKEYGVRLAQFEGLNYHAARLKM